MTKWANAHKAKPGDDYWPWYQTGIRPVSLAPLPERARVEAGEVVDDDNDLGDFSDWSLKDLNACRLWMGE